MLCFHVDYTYTSVLTPTFWYLISFVNWWTFVEGRLGTLLPQSAPLGNLFLWFPFPALHFSLMPAGSAFLRLGANTHPYPLVCSLPSGIFASLWKLWEYAFLSLGAKLHPYPLVLCLPSGIFASILELWSLIAIFKLPELVYCVLLQAALMYFFRFSDPFLAQLTSPRASNFLIPWCGSLTFCSGLFSACDLPLNVLWILCWTYSASHFGCALRFFECFFLAGRHLTWDSLSFMTACKMIHVQPLWFGCHMLHFFPPLELRWGSVQFLPFCSCSCLIFFISPWWRLVLH